MKTTKSPWHYALTFVENGEDYLAIIGTPNGKEDNLPHRGAFIGKITGKRERREANARLIAAAPDLLESLEIAEGIVENARDSGKGGEACLQMMRAAIAKAKGGEQ